MRAEVLLPLPPLIHTVQLRMHEDQGRAHVKHLGTCFDAAD
jgi:hypothetical protein